LNGTTIDAFAGKSTSLREWQVSANDVAAVRRNGPDERVAS
jgi:hypothetical protein